MTPDENSRKVKTSPPIAKISSPTLSMSRSASEPSASRVLVLNTRKQESSAHNIAARNARQAQIGNKPTEMGAQHCAEAGSAISEELPFRGRNDMADPEDGEACEPKAGIDAPGRGKDVTERQERENQSKDDA